MPIKHLHLFSTSGVNHDWEKAGNANDSDKAIKGSLYLLDFMVQCLFNN